MGSQNSRWLTPPGQLVDTGGFRLHALVRGEGTPVVLLEPALGGFALQYGRIQAAVSQFTRVMAYDRAGQGWSDPRPGPRKPAVLAGELWALLGRLDLRPPYILVGHSLGGLLARIYAGLHPQEIAGVVLIDSSHEHQHGPTPDLGKMYNQAAMGVNLMRVASRLGLGKWLTRLSLGSAAKTLPAEDLDTFVTVASRLSHHETMLAEFSQYHYYFGSESEVPRTLGDIPLTVVTAEKSISGKVKIGEMTADQMNEQHQKLQKDLVHLSSQGEQVLVPGATHLSILMQPEHTALVVEAIRCMVERVRAMP